VNDYDLRNQCIAHGLFVLILVILLSGCLEDDSGTEENSTPLVHYQGTICREVVPDRAPGTTGAIVFDKGRGRLVFVSIEPFQTWEWVLDRWVRRETIHHPDELWTWQMEYFPPEQRVILIGKNYKEKYVQTWGYDGHDWTRIETAHQFSDMLGPLAYDPKRQCLVTVINYHGYDCGPDLYFYAAGQWQRQSVPPLPLDHSVYTRGFGYDAGRDCYVLVIMYMVWDHHYYYFYQTYEFTGSQWVLVSTSGFEDGKIVYDEDHQTLLAFSNHDSGAGHSIRIEQFIEGQWVPVDNFKTVTRYFDVTWNPLEHKMTLFSRSFTLTWSFETGWREKTSSEVPVNSHYCTAAYYPEEQTTVFLISRAEPVIRDETWFWDGTSFSRKETTLMLDSVFAENNLVYDPAGKRLLLFGVLDQTEDNNSSNTGRLDVWEYGSDDWSLLKTSGTAPWPPDQETSAPLAAFPDIEAIIVIRSYYYSQYFQTWQFRKNNWGLLTTAHTPPGRTHSALVYDESGHRLLLFGGFGVPDKQTYRGCYNDVWAFDGLDWQRIETSNPPPGRENASLIFESATGKIVLTGGNSEGHIFNDVWEFSPDTGIWRERTVAGDDPGRTEAASAYDPVRDRLIIWGGLSDIGPYGFFPVDIRGSLLELQRSN